MELRNLKTFATVAQTMNFTKAAQILGYAQSSVTAQIKNLEQELGIKVFHRLGRGISLTKQGKLLLVYAKRFLALEQETVKSLAQQSEALTVLTFCSAESILTYRLPVLLAGFREKWPKVKLLFKPDSITEFRGQIKNQKVDLAFIMEDPSSDNQLCVETLSTEPVWLLAGPDHRLGKLSRVTPLDLLGEPILFTEAGCDYRNQFESILIKEGIFPQTALEFTSIEAIKKCVAQNMGIAVLPKMSVEKEVKKGKLIKLCWQGKKIQVTTKMAWLKNRIISKPLQGFLDEARACLGNQQ